MPVLRHIPWLATCAGDGAQSDLGGIADAAVATSGGIVTWVGRDADLTRDRVDGPEIASVGGVVVPGLVDCHTHLAFGGWRADEFARRCRGATYGEIAAAGGGIRSTMRQTRLADEAELVERSRGFLAGMKRLGVTTVEAKSGYGLTVRDELKQLRAYRKLALEKGTEIVPTLLAAHIVPPEFADDRDEWIRIVCEELIPAVAADRLAEYCDVFVEEGAYTAGEARRILRAAAASGLGARLHVDQFSETSGALLAAECGAASADHLECATRAGARAMAAAGVTAVALPLASLYLRRPPMDARMFIEAGCRVAVATDFNPGSAPSYHLPLALTLSCVMNGLTPAEALKGATRIAAASIGRAGRCGSVEPGARADLVEIDADSVEEWLYHLRPNAAARVWCAGRPVTEPRPGS